MCSIATVVINNQTILRPRCRLVANAACRCSGGTGRCRAWPKIRADPVQSLKPSLVSVWVRIRDCSGWQLAGSRLGSGPDWTLGTTHTITIESSTNSATALSRMNFSGYVGHVAKFTPMFTIACCFVVGLMLGLGLGSELLCGWSVVMHTCFYYFRLSLSHCRVLCLAELTRLC